MKMKKILFVVLLGCVYGYPTIGNNDLPPADPLGTNITFYTRQDWGAVPPTDVRPLNTPVEYVVIHHTYIPAACYTREECSADMRSMQKFHMTQDFGDIGYHFCVGSEGGAYEGRGWKWVGVHATKANNVSVGICLIGDWRVQQPGERQLQTAKDLIAAGVGLGYIRSDYKLIGHREVTPTECPGDALFTEISKWDHFTSKFE